MTPDRAAQIAANFDLRDLPDDFYTCPYPVYAALRQSQPICQMPDGSLLLTRHADLVSIYRDAQTFSSDKKIEFAPKFNASEPLSDQNESPLFEHHTSSLVFNDPPVHTHVRRVIMGALSRRAVDEMEAGLTELVDRLLDAIEAKGGGDLIEDFAAAIPVEVIGNLLAIPFAERSPLRAWSLAILGALEPRLTSEQLAKGNQAVIEFKSYLKTLVQARRKRPGDPEHDVLTRLIQSEQAGQALSETHLLHNCIFILNAGHETTTNLIANALVAIYEHPEVRFNMLQINELLPHVLPNQNNELNEKIDLAIDEFLRFEPSNQLGNRRAVRDFELDGKSYPAGTLITLCIAAANRDPAVFERPDEIILDRNPNRHLAFGLGVHQCAGLSLARLEGRIAITRFLQRFPDFTLTQAPTRAKRARFRGLIEAPFRSA